ncbi:MAG: LytTR family DNA-binding domain-containing protein [Bacteroidota bacterium]
MVDDDAVSRTLLEEFVRRHEALVLAGSCSSGVEAANVLATDVPDVLLLDVEMPELSGIELLRSQGSGDQPAVVLVTAKQEYAVEAFEVDVDDYLVKPVSYARFLQAIERVRTRRAPEPAPASDEGLFVKTEGRLVRLDLDTVQYVEAQDDYVLIHTATARHLVHSTMKKLEAALPAEAFARVHRSYIVRLDQIADIEDHSLVIGRQVLPIGATYRPRLLARIQTL